MKGIYTYGYRSMELLRKCPKCKKKTEHSEHGFRGHNYGLKCKECGSWNYDESD
jgi:uncharacterized Zn finger protein